MLEPENRDPSVIIRSRLIGIRPTDPAYVAHTGATFESQGENGVAKYILNNTDDTIDFDVSVLSDVYEKPLIEIKTAYGPTAFDLVDRSDSSVIISDESGFDTNSWVVDISDGSTELRLTNFTDTQAAIVPYVEPYEGK